MINPETAFNALGGVMELYKESLQEAQQKIQVLQALVAQQQKVIDSLRALQVKSAAEVHVRGGSSGGRAGGDGSSVGEAHEEHQEAPGVQGGEGGEPPQALGGLQEQRQRVQRQREQQRVELTEPFSVAIEKLARDLGEEPPEWEPDGDPV